MAEEVKTTRAYHSPLRAAQAEQTRRRVLEAARRLFQRRGYAGTTVAAVADAAGVSPETIYLSLGGKRGLLEGVMEITGPHESAATDETWWQMVADLPSARRAPRQERRVQLPHPRPHPTRSTPSSAAPPTRKPSPPRSAGNCSTSGSPTRPNGSAASSPTTSSPD